MVCVTIGRKSAEAWRGESSVTIWLGQAVDHLCVLVPTWVLIFALLLERMLAIFRAAREQAARYGVALISRNKLPSLVAAPS
jgi:hypothetical protein